MSIEWFLLVSMYCAISVVGLDLGPIVRIGQCRSECLRKHSIDGSCKWYSNRSEAVCNECWQNCEALENTEEDARTICEGDQYQHCPACQTACAYHNTRVAEKYEPSMLPAPDKGPVSLDPYDVAIIMHRVHQQWEVSGYYHGNQAPNLQPFTWIIVITEDGLRHYSWQEWVPTLDSLKEGPLFEATISWRDMRLQLQRQLEREQKNFNDRVRQLFLEKYGEKVLTEWHSQDKDSRTITRDVFRRFFFKRRDDVSETERLLEANGSPSTGRNGLFVDDGAGATEDARSSKKQSFVVSWGPETGGLTGNQVTDCDSAQISLLPGTKYLVRVASNDGPGSFPIVVDTRPTASSSSSLPSSSPVHVCRLGNHLWRDYFWHYLLAFNIIAIVGLLGWIKCYTIYGKMAVSEATVEKV